MTGDPISTQTACDSYAPKVMIMLCIPKPAVSVFGPRIGYRE